MHIGYENKMISQQHREYTHLIELLRGRLNCYFLDKAQYVPGFRKGFETVARESFPHVYEQLENEIRELHHLEHTDGKQRILGLEHRWKRLMDSVATLIKEGNNAKG